MESRVNLFCVSLIYAHLAVGAREQINIEFYAVPMTTLELDLVLVLVTLGYCPTIMETMVIR